MTRIYRHTVADAPGADGRAAFAAITPQGRSLVRKARQSHHELLRHTFAGALDDDDLANLARIMDRLGAAIPGRVAERAGG